MRVEWRPDAYNVYLSSGTDNLALHQTQGKPESDEGQRLDHIGFILDCPASVDQWHEYLRDRQVPIRQAPKTHRDGTRSFYCADPEGNLVQMIYHPSLSHGD